MAKLRHIAMQVPDLEKAAEFYETVFGMERVAHGNTPFGNAVMLSDGVINMALLNFPEGTKGQINGRDWAGLHHFGFMVDDADEAFRKLTERGIEGVVAPEDRPWGQRTAYVRDPAGNLVELAEDRPDRTRS